MRGLVQLLMLITVFFLGNRARAQIPETIWAYNLGSSNSVPALGDAGVDVARAPDGTVVVLVRFEGTADFNPGAGVTSLSTSGRTAAVLKYDRDGVLL